MGSSSNRDSFAAEGCSQGRKEKSNKVLYRKNLGNYMYELLIPVQSWKERVFALLQYGSGGCSGA